MITLKGVESVMKCIYLLVLMLDRATQRSVQHFLVELKGNGFLYFLSGTSGGE